MNGKDISSKVVCLIDMDCFYCQVEEKLDASLKGKPLAVVQYNAWQGGGIIAVNYAARDRGVTRHMRGDEAKKHCPEIELVKVPSVREKADLTKYREAGKEVAVVLQKFTSLLERASVDEAYLDISEQVNDRLKLLNEGQFRLLPQTLINTYAVGYSNVGDFVKLISRNLNVPGSDDQDDVDEETRTSNLKLLIGATIVNEIRARVKEETGYECSAGIAHNKIVAKLACGLNKPNKQTVLPLSGIPDLFKTLAVNKIRGLGGKFGEIVCETLKVKYMGDLLRFSERELQSKFDEKNGTFLYLICRGVDLEPVTPKYTSKSIGCCKRFPGKNAIKGIESLNHWLKELATEIHDRLDKDFEENNRRAQLLTVSFMQTINGGDVSSSRSIALDSYDVEKIVNDALECMKKNTVQFMCMQVQGGLYNPVKFLGLSVGKFEKISNNRNRIQEMFKQQIQTKESKENKPPVDGAMEVDIKPTVDIVPLSNVKMEIPSSKVNFFQKYFNKPSISNSTLVCAETIATNEETAMDIVDEIVNNIKEEPPAENDSCNGEENMETLKIKSVSDINVEISDLTSVPSTSRDIKETIKVEDPNESHASTSPMNYTMEYAEYAIPQNFNWDEYMKECPQCNKKIMNYEFQSHMDYHFAKELDQSLKAEDRADVQRNTIKSSPKQQPSKQRKKQSFPTSTIKVVPIVKFFQKGPHELPKSDEQIVCDNCKRSITLKNFPEHIEYHCAGREVGSEEKKERTQSSTITPPTAKRKSIINSSQKPKSIASFFSTQN